MIADPLTKAMSCERLSKTLSRGIFDLKPTEESLYIKEKNKAVRKKAREAKKSLRAGEETIESGLPTIPEGDNEANVAEATPYTEDDSDEELRKDRIAEQEREIPESALYPKWKPTGAKKPGYWDQQQKRWVTLREKKMQFQ